MAVIVCVLKESAEYKPAHVQWLARQVPGLVCITHSTVPDVPTIAPDHDWPGWWSKLNLFNPSLIQDDLLYLDLDTVALGPLDDLMVGHTTMLSDFYKPSLPASGLMYIRHEDKGAVWTAWLQNPAKHMARCTTREHWGDQGFLRDALPAKRWDAVRAGQVVSYKVHCKGGKVPDGARVVCFHGQPRPWAVSHPWIPRL